MVIFGFFRWTAVICTRIYSGAAPRAGLETGFVYLFRLSAKVAKHRKEERNGEEKPSRPLKRLKSGEIGRYFGKATTTKCDFE